MKLQIKLSVLSGLLLLMVACSHYDELQTSKEESKNGEEESHNQGRDCMQCHKAGGEAGKFDNKKWWNIGGTIYTNGFTPSSNGKVYLYTQPNGQGELKYVIEVDALGNIYTNQIIDFRGGLYPYVVSATGGVAYMSSALPHGKCNSCHGVTTERITVN
jgi:hypothetical protein